MNILGSFNRLTAAGAILAACATASAQTYRITNIGTLGGPTASAFTINNQGHVGGASTREDAASHGFFWDGAMHEMDPIDGTIQGHVYALSNDDLAAASSFNLGDVQQHGVLWDGGSPTLMGEFSPRGINTAGAVIGHITYNDATLGWIDRAARWDSGTLDLLGGLGGDYDYAYAIADNGTIVGASRLAGNGSQRACLWQGGFVRDLGTLGGADSQAYALNEAGDVVGWAITSTGAPHAFLFETSGGAVITRTDLGELAGGYSYAYAVNESRQVVGASDARAFLWQDGTMIDLNAEIPSGTGWLLEAAWDINEAGWIVGVGQYNGFTNAFLLTPAGCADLNADGVVDLSDLTIMLSHYGMTKDATIVYGDLDGDGDVDLTDLSNFLSQFGTTCS